MYVNLKLIVICVLLNFVKCNVQNCEDVYKCVSDWIAAVFSPNKNFSVDTIKDVSKTTKAAESGENVLNDLTGFLSEKFPNIFKQGRLLEVVGNKTKIYVQTFKINDSIFDKIPSIDVTTVKPDMIDDIYSYLNNYNQSDILKLQHFQYDTFDAEDENETTSIYQVTEDFLGIKDKYNAIDNESAFETTTVKVDVIENDNSKNTIKESYKTDFKNSSDTNVNILDNITTTPVTLKNESFPEMVNKYNAEIRNSILSFTTFKTEVMNNKKTNHTAPDIQTKTKEHNHITTIKSKLMENHNANDKNNYTNDRNKEFKNNSEMITPKIYNKTIIPISHTHSEENEIVEAVNVPHNLLIFSKIGMGEFTSDNFTDYLDIDYVDIYKDTTNEDVEYTPVTYIPTTTESVKLLIDKKPEDGIDSVYPWIAALFIMNADNKQFEYICDGILVSELVVLTAARCVIGSNATVDTANILVILGKKSLQTTGPNEKVLRINSIKLHENFYSTEGKFGNDLAVIVLDERVSFSVDIQRAPLGIKDTSEPFLKATTGWHVSGPLQPLYLVQQDRNRCIKENDAKYILCFSLADSVTTCPSYGGMLVDKQGDNHWRVKGIATGNPINRGVCFNKDVAFTRIDNYLEWIMKNINEASK